MQQELLHVGAIRKAPKCPEGFPLIDNIRHMEICSNGKVPSKTIPLGLAFWLPHILHYSSSGGFISGSVTAFALSFQVGGEKRGGGCDEKEEQQ